MAIAGFRTDDQYGSLYAIDAEGRTVRHNQSGHSAHGKVEEACKCLYLTQVQAKTVHDALRSNDVRVRIVCLNRETRNLHQWAGDDSKMPDGNHYGIGIFNQQTGQLMDTWPASTTPAVGLSPFEMSYGESGGNLVASRHIGHPIYKIYDSETIFDSDLIQSGFSPFFNKAPVEINPPRQPRF